MATAAQVIARFQQVRTVRGGWTARCPAHEDRKPSLSIAEKDGKTLLHCHAGCAPEAVCDAVGLTVSDLFDDGPRIVDTYDYIDEQGELLFQTLRYDPKDFKQRRPVGEGEWIWNLQGVRRVLYRLPEVLAASEVLICEGEKDCGTARDWGLVATCNPMGAGKWRDEYSEVLRGTHVTIIADADKPGQKHAEQVATSLVGKANSVKVVELPDAHDLSDWAYGKAGTREELLALIRNAPEWTAQSERDKHSESHPAGDQQDEVAAGPVLVRECFTDVEAKPIIWMWKDRIPKNKLTVFSGNPDCGKTTVLIDLIARYTTGRAYPDGSENAIEPGEVLMLIAEDDPGDTIKPRLVAAGADLSRVSYLKAVQVKNGAKQIERMLALDHDLDLLEKSLRENPNIGLVTLDPISGYLGKAELNKEQELRRVLVPIKELAEKLGVTFIGLGHFNKRSDVSALHKVGGAVAMSGVPRAVWMFAKNPEADDEYLMLLGKGNLTKKRTGMKYRFGEKLLPNGFDAPFIVWQGDSVGDADSVFTVAGDPTEKRKAKAKRFLADYLADGDQKSEDIEAKGKAQGISRGALFEAKKEMGIKAEKSAGQWWWSLPKEAQEFQPFH